MTASGDLRVDGVAVQFEDLAAELEAQRRVRDRWFVKSNMQMEVSPNVSFSSIQQTIQDGRNAGIDKFVLGNLKQ